VPDSPDGEELSLTVEEDARLLTIEEAARRLRIGRTTMYGLISNGDVETVNIGRRRLVPPECLDDYVTALRASRQPETAAA
jgi:excisionase family DNA binding protein